MIRYSDNAAADVLYRKIGRGRGLSRINRRFGLRTTFPYPRSWGASQTNPADQLTLLRVLTTAPSLLTASNRRFVRRLMESVTRSQRWGISAGARSGERVALKNGWTPLRFQGTGWAVHSIGRIHGHGHDLLVAIMTTGSPNAAAGIRTVEGLARLTVPRLRRLDGSGAG
jgi:beta-lactamase class A